MTTQEVASMINSIGLPYSYYQFNADTAQPPPFICFFYPENDDFLADNTNYLKVYRLVIELYTDSKDFELESRVEAVLTQNGLVYSREETPLDDERMFEVIYNTEVIIDV